jgi:alpha-beta hydrolase superfamily lysophospholipase/thiol-disulfide isomerase/thioredoxin
MGEIVKFNVSLGNCSKFLLAFSIVLSVSSPGFCQQALDDPSGMSNSSDGAQAQSQDQSKDVSAKDSKKVKTEDKSAGGDAPCLSWIDPNVKPWAAMLCVHGLGLASDAYTGFGKHMAALGVATYAIDVRGFGSWMRAKGHEQVDFKACLSDVAGALKAIRRANPDIPVFLLGESMGGAVALQAAALYPDLIDGLISAVPAGERFKQKRTDLKVALQILSAGPNKEFPIGKEIVNQATNNPELAERWENDPLDRMDLSPKELVQFQDFMNQNHDKAKLITAKPVLMFQGSQDKLVKPEGTIELFNEMTTSDKNLVLLGDAEHLIFEKGQFDSAIVDGVTAWLYRHTFKKAAAIAFIKSMVMATSDLPAVPQLPSSPASTSMPPNAVASASLSSDSFVPLTATARAGNTAMTHVHIAKMLMTSDPQNARLHLRKALSMAADPQTAKQANSQLLRLPAHIIKPNLGTATRPIAGRYGLLTKAKQARIKSKVDPVSAVKPIVGGNLADVSVKKPTVISFCAAWCEPCNQLDSALERAKDTFGDRVNFVSVDADDPKNAPLIEEYGVSPIPTILFLDSDNEVVDYMVGYSSDAALFSNIQKVL